MSTRAVYTFTDEHETLHVYKHHDGYPKGAAEFIREATKFAWELPRFEADEFASAFVAANKSLNGKPLPGGLRLMKSGDWKDVSPGDIEYHYTIRCEAGILFVEADSVHEDYKTGQWTVEPVFNGSLDDFCKTHA